jgi:diguanylate cyclase (GGDEF)-like protein
MCRCRRTTPPENYAWPVDRLGHVAGDEVLRTVGCRLKGGVRQRDAVARVGGDEFAVILGGLDPDQATSVVERIRQGVAHPMGDHPGTMWQVTASAGYVTVNPGTPLTPHEAMAAADRFLRQAKQEGRDRTVGGAYQVGEPPSP